MNPVQEFNRYVSVACIRVWSEEMDREKEDKFRRAEERRVKRLEQVTWERPKGKGRACVRRSIQVGVIQLKARGKPLPPRIQLAIRRPRHGRSKIARGMLVGLIRCAARLTRLFTQVSYAQVRPPRGTLGDWTTIYISGTLNKSLLQGLPCKPIGLPFSDLL